MKSNKVKVDTELINNRITEIEKLCEHIKGLKDELRGITDSSSEGLFYSKYIECIGEFIIAIDTSENVIKGYINFMEYIRDNYKTMSNDLAEAIKKL
ncbi:MAG: hypothetical protein IJO70_11985 [Lachnospiraceae bacterium]|nr:hypothetical protein [Lachnospiraceae bacterium]